MSDRWKDTTILILIVVGVIALILAVLMNFSLFLTVLLVIIGIIILVVAGLIIFGLVATIPYYFAKHGKESEPGIYELDKVKPVKEDEKK
ncbi:MAG: hypothetical protein LUQ16_07675 [Methanomassiliicoccales archaeon]|nr:hypothetical protein [Methanomassiliicoccales archaeon]